MGTLEGTIAALVMEKGNSAIWAIKWDTRLLTAAYSVRIPVTNPYNISEMLYSAYICNMHGFGCRVSYVQDLAITFKE